MFPNMIFPSLEAAEKRRIQDGYGPLDKPEGKPNCLNGLTLVFTGELETLSREEATEYGKRLGAKVTGAPSGQTSYMITGEGAGAGKIAKAKSLDLPTLSEAQFYNLVRYRPAGGELTEKQKEAQLKAEQAMRDDAERMRKEEVEQEKARARKEKVAGREGIATKYEARNRFYRRCHLY